MTVKAQQLTRDSAGSEIAQIGQWEQGGNGGVHIQRGSCRVMLRARGLALLRMAHLHTVYLMISRSLRGWVLIFIRFGWLKAQIPGR